MSASEDTYFFLIYLGFKYLTSIAEKISKYLTSIAGSVFAVVPKRLALFSKVSALAPLAAVFDGLVVIPNRCARFSLSFSLFMSHSSAE